MAVDDAFNDERFNREHLRKWGIRSVLVMPVFVKGEVVGVMYFNYQKSAVRFKQAHLDFANQLSSSLSLALENSQLFENLEAEIVERKQVEQDLRESEVRLRASEKLYRAIGESIDYGIWICDPDGRNLYASQSFLDLLGITQEQCSEFGWGNSLHPDDAERTIAAWKECARTGGTWDIEHRYLGKDGRYHPILSRGVPVRDEQGNIINWAGINLDISRLKQTEEALRVSEEHFQVALKNSPMLVYTTDRDLRYTWIYNPALGFSQDQMIGKTDEDINDPEKVAGLTALKRSVLESGVGKRQEIELGYQGELYYYDATVEPIRANDGEITGLTVAAIDITETRRMEQARLQDQLEIELQRRLMDQREQERMRIARDLHDGPIQTLSSTTFNLQLVKETFPDELLEVELNQIGLNIKDVMHELRALLYDLRPPTLMHFGLSKVIHIYAQDLQERHPEIALELDVMDDERRVPDETRLALFRIFQAGLDNVVKHAHADRVWIAYNLQSDQFFLQLRDNGAGFDVTKDYDLLTKEGHFGLLGMKERAEAIGAVFSVESEIGKGTTITVSGPIHR